MIAAFAIHSFCGKVCGDRSFSCYNFLNLQHFQQIALVGDI
jgi:hypothetical protein